MNYRMHAKNPEEDWRRGELIRSRHLALSHDQGEVMALHQGGLTAFEIAATLGRPSAEVWRLLYDAADFLRR